jgi:hypothetical protein
MAQINFIDGPRKGNNLNLGKSQTAAFNAHDKIRVPHMNKETGELEYWIYERIWDKNHAKQWVPTLNYKLAKK